MNGAQRSRGEDTVRAEVPGIPCDAGGPVFGAPWQAQAFAMTLALYERGLFTWTEWAAALAARIAAAPAQPGEDAGDAYWRQWLEALEDMVAAKGASSLPELQRYQQAWDHAADRTPHGQPVTLAPADFPPALTAAPAPPAETGPQVPAAPGRHRGSG